MYDAIADDQFPPGAAAYAAYVDGDLANQPNYSYIVSAFPKAEHLSITLFPDKDADALDIENGAATPESAASWYERQKARGIARPALYADVSTMESDVVPVITAAKIARATVRLWTAHYGAGEHICGPKSCARLSIDADGTQWTDTAMGRSLDQSLLLADFFGDPKPAPAESWEDKLVATIPVIGLGSGNLQAVKNWQGILVAHGYDLGSSGEFGDGVDGVFGDVTRQRTLTFQASKGVAQDGQVGAKTWTAALTA
jgi:hypothetical protein